MKKFNFLLMLFISLSMLSCADDGAPGPAGEDGMDGIDGIDGEDGLNGQDGNANVTLHKFDGHDWNRSSLSQRREIPLADKDEYDNSSFYTYLIYENPPLGAFPKFPLDGYGRGENTFFTTVFLYLSGDDGPRAAVDVAPLTEGTAFDNYNEIHVIQMVSSNTEDHTSGGRVDGSGLDYSDYDAVVEYYGLD